jgi:hypothetical protein
VRPGWPPRPRHSKLVSAWAAGAFLDLVPRPYPPRRSAQDLGHGAGPHCQTAVQQKATPARVADPAQVRGLTMRREVQFTRVLHKQHGTGLPLRFTQSLVRYIRLVQQTVGRLPFTPGAGLWRQAGIRSRGQGRAQWHGATVAARIAESSGTP